jgi:opacity protein-like surface antigen
MKTMKVALLATAGLAAVSISARADEVSDMKTQLEALNARIARLEAAPAVPTGFSLLTLSEGQASAIPGLEEQDAASYGDKAHVIGVMPTADMPATATIEWSGFVRAAIEYDTYGGAFSGNNGDDDLNIRSRAELKLSAKTDTSVGEVGVLIKFRANANVLDSRGVNPTVVSPEYWGYWAMTPEWTLGAGYSGSLSNVPYGYDGFCACYYVDNSTAFDLNPNDAQQMRLSYVSGPLSFAVAIEDGSNTGNTITETVATGDLNGNGVIGDTIVGDGLDDSLGVTGRLKYDGDAFSAGVMGGYWSKDDWDPIVDPNETKWQIGAGASFSLGDMATLSLGAAYGSLFDSTDYWTVSGGLSADLSESVNAQLGVGYKKFQSADHVWAIAGGVYWNPVDQLTIGLEAEHSRDSGGGFASGDVTTVDLVTVFRF